MTLPYRWISLYLTVLSPKVSAEPDGLSYVFQGFIQGKDYGQFGLQRLGNSLFPIMC